MTLARQLTAPALIATLVATAACSGGGAPGAAPSDAIPAAAFTRTSPTAAAVQSTASAAAVQSITAASDTDDITPADIAAINAPASEDVPDPTGDAVTTDAYGWKLTGFYHGKLKGFVLNNPGSSESSGYLALHIDASLPSYTGTGEATEYGTGGTLSFTLSGSVESYFAHGESVSMTALDSNGCPASGTARRFPHLFEGVLYSAGCGNNAKPVTYYFKVRPNKT